MEGYSFMVECHIKASALIKEAESPLNNDTVGWLRLLAQEFEKGIEKSILDVTDDNAEKAEELRFKMLENLERVKELQKNYPSTSLEHTDVVSASKPTESLGACLAKMPSKMATPGEKRKGDTGKKGKEDTLGEIIERCIIKPENNEVLMDNIVGLENAKQVINDAVVLPRTKEKWFTGLRIPPKGLLLFGPPGNGKTLFAKAVAHECKSTFINITSADIISHLFGEGEKLVKKLFERARNKQPSIIFIDEVDSLLSDRSGGENDAMRRLKDQFLIEINGVHSSTTDKMLLIGATNRPFDLDEAVRRRFPKRIHVPLPKFQDRKIALQKLVAENTNCLSEIEISKIASRTHGYSFDDLCKLAEDAAFAPVRDTDLKEEEPRPIKYNDFSLTRVKRSVSIESAKQCKEWNDKYGQGQ